MFKKLLLGAIPTLVAGIAVLTMSAPYNGRVARSRCHASQAFGPRLSCSTPMDMPRTRRPKTRIGSNRGTVNSGDQAELTSRQHPDWGRGYHGYRGYRGYRGYGHYYGYRPITATGAGRELDEE